MVISLQVSSDFPGIQPLIEEVADVQVVVDSGLNLILGQLDLFHGQREGFLSIRLTMAESTVSIVTA